MPRTTHGALVALSLVLMPYPWPSRAELNSTSDAASATPTLLASIVVIGPQRVCPTYSLGPKRSSGARLLGKSYQAVEAANPAAFVARAHGVVGNSLVRDDYFRRVAPAIQSTL